MAKDQDYWDGIMKALDYNEEIMGKLSEDQKTLLEKADELGQWKLIAEVTSCASCSMGHKVGDRYVFEPGGKLLTEECSDPICVWALANMLPFAFMVLDRIVEGIDPDGIHWRSVRCADTTWKHGGVGECVFRVHAEKK